jgi:hypothetical protein
MPVASFTDLGPRKFDNLWGGQPFPVEAAEYLIAGSQTLNQPGALTPTTMLPGTVVGSGAAGIVIVKSSAGDGSQNPIGVFLGPALETASGAAPGAIALTGSFDVNSLKFSSPDTYATFAAKLNALNIYAEATIVAAPSMPTVTMVQSDEADEEGPAPAEETPAPTS